jgi:hypothetical protein
VQAKRILASNWFVSHYYNLLGLTGIAMFVLAYPVSNLFRLSPEEQELAAEYFEMGLPYKGKDIVNWRHDWLDVMLNMIFVGFGFIAAAVGLRFYFRRQK